MRHATLRHRARGWGIAAIAALSLGGFAPVALAQDSPVSTPGTAVADEPIEIQISDVDGANRGHATFTAAGSGVHVEVTVTDLPPGDHGIHIHMIGICDPSAEKPFSSAGDHFNPNGATHGSALLATPGATPAASDAHGGDLGNIHVNDDGTGSKQFDTDLITLALDQPNSLNDGDGSAIVIHADPDDLVTDPSGNSGDRIACGVIFPENMSATPVPTADA